MKPTKCILFFLFVAICLGCQQEDNELSSNKPIRIVSEILTRSAMESGFNVNDNIGIFMLKRTVPNTPATISSTGGNWIDNTEFYLDTNGQTWNSTYPIYWDDQTSIVDVIGYYPHREISSDITDMTQLPIQINKDQSSLEALRKSDFLYANCRNITPANRDHDIALGFKHKLCKLTVHLDITANGYPMNSVPSVVANHVYIDALVNLNDGSVKCGDTQSDVIFHYDAENQLAEAILPPQTIKAGTLITVIFKDISMKAYTYNIKENLVLKSGKEYIVNFSNHVDTKIILPIDSISVDARGSAETYFEGKGAYTNLKFEYQSNADIAITQAPSWLEVEHLNSSIRIFNIANNFTLFPRKGEIIIEGGGVTKKIKLYQKTLPPTIKKTISLNASKINKSQWGGDTGEKNMQHYDITDIPSWLTCSINDNSLHVTALEANRSEESRSYILTIYRGEYPEYEFTITQKVARLIATNTFYVSSTATSAFLTVTHDFDLTLSYPDSSWVEYPVKNGGVIPQIMGEDYQRIPITFTANSSGAARSTILTISNGIQSITVNIIQSK